MPDESKTTYPNIPVKHWWEIRRRFKQRIPGTVTANYIATALDMQEKSAQANIIPSLVMFGIIDQDGKPTDRAVSWRDDEQYPEVCEQIRQEIYPQELRDALPGPSPDRQAADRWFANRLGVGERAARRMGAVYEVLAKADPTQETSTTPSKSRMRAPRSRPTEATMAAVPEASRPVGAVGVKPSKPVTDAQVSPSLHIDIQVHISPEASAEQIDQIFASMAKHLFRD